MIKSEWEHIPEVQDIIEKVGTLINQLTKTNLHGNELVKIETGLAAYYAYLAGKTAENQANMNSKYWIRKIAYSRKYSILRHKTSQGDASNEANEFIEEEINAEQLANFRFEHLKMFCKGIELNLISIAHRLKQLASESAHNKHGNQ